MHDDIFAELTKLASELSKKTSQLDEIMQALHTINLSIGDREKMQKLINHMTKFNKPKPVSPAPANKPSATPTGGPKGDFLYDVFTSPTMLSIIKEHYSKKKKR